MPSPALPIADENVLSAESVCFAESLARSNASIVACLSETTVQPWNWW